VGCCCANRLAGSVPLPQQRPGHWGCKLWLQTGDHSYSSALALQQTVLPLSAAGCCVHVVWSLKDGARMEPVPALQVCHAALSAAACLQQLMGTLWHLASQWLIRSNVTSGQVPCSSAKLCRHQETHCACTEQPRSGCGGVLLFMFDSIHAVRCQRLGGCVHAMNGFNVQ
jgi:hypothetical protein